MKKETDEPSAGSMPAISATEADGCGVSSEHASAELEHRLDTRQPAQTNTNPTSVASLRRQLITEILVMRRRNTIAVAEGFMYGAAFRRGVE